MNIFLFIYFLFALLMPRIGPINILDVFNLLLIIYILLSKNRVKKLYIFKKEILYSLFMLFISFLFLLLNLFFNNGEVSVHFVYRFIRLCLVLISTIYIISIMNEKNIDILMSKIIPSIFIIHSIVILLEILDSNIKLFFVNFAINFDQELALQYMRISYRTPGLFGGYDSANVFSAIGILYFIYKKNISIIFKSLSVCLLILSMFVTARVGMYSLIILLSSLFIIKFIIFKHNTKSMLYGITFLIFVIFIFNLYINKLIILPGGYEYLLSSLNRSFELFRNISEGSSVSTSSTDKLFAYHYHLPSDFKTLFIGNTFPSYQYGTDFWYRSDVEFIELIYGNGIFITILFYAFILFMAMNSYKEKNEYSKLFLLILFLLFIGMFKGKYFLTLHFINIYILLYVVGKIIFFKRKLND